MNSNKKQALMTASVASMIDLFNMDNIHILQELGYEITVATNFKFGSITSQERVDAFRQELEEAGIRAIHVPIPRSITDIRHILQSCHQMKQLCETEHYDIVHTQSPIGGVVVRMAAKASRKAGTRVIYTAHGFHFFKGASKKNWLLFYPIEKHFSRYTDVLITINQEDYEQAQKFHAGKAAYVPGIGVHLEKFHRDITAEKKQELREELGLSQDDYVLLGVGQLSKRKNQEIVIKAMAEVVNPRVKYVLVGFGEQEEADRDLVEELNLADKVIFAGYRRDVRDLLHMADCFVFPSLQEGLPAALMEAMAAGLPIICSDIRGNHDLVENGVEGCILDCYDQTAYARAIDELSMDVGKQNSYSENAWKKIQGFGNETVQKVMRDIYENCRQMKTIY